MFDFPRIIWSFSKIYLSLEGKGKYSKKKKNVLYLREMLSIWNSNNNENTSFIKNVFTYNSQLVLQDKLPQVFFSLGQQSFKAEVPN